MTSLRESLEGNILSVAWSAWVEMGVSGWPQDQVDWAIDPEALILLTAGLGEADPRLRDEATDWCIQYGRYISRARLRNMLKRETTYVRENFGEFASTVNAHSSLRWPAESRPRHYRPTGRSTLTSVHSPALLALRLRSLFGVSARAEILRVFLSRPGDVLSVADIAEIIGYTKRNVADALESLGMTRFVSPQKYRNQIRYSLSQYESFSDFAGPLPSTFPRCDILFRVLLQALEIVSEFENADPSVRAVEARRMVSTVESDLAVTNLPVPEISNSGTAFWDSFCRWSNGLIEELKK